MPFIEFVCKGCGKVFGELVRTGEKAPCPGCGSAETAQNYNGVCYAPKSKSSGKSCGKTCGCSKCGGC